MALFYFLLLLFLFWYYHKVLAIDENLFFLFDLLNFFFVLHLNFLISLLHVLDCTFSMLLLYLVFYPFLSLPFSFILYYMYLFCQCHFSIHIYFYQVFYHKPCHKSLTTLIYISKSNAKHFVWCWKLLKEVYRWKIQDCIKTSPKEQMEISM